MPPPAHGLAARLIAGPTLRTQSDRRLVKLVREGYESAFEEIVRRYGGPLGRYAASIVGNRSEDVTQDAFSRALIALRRDGSEIELRPWLYRIVRNAALNDLRDRPPAAAELAEAIARGGNPAETLAQREELTELMERLRSLPEAQRAAIVMRELEGLSHEEIAAALGLSGGGARQAIYRARRALRDGAGMLVPLPLLKALLVPEGAAAADAAGGVVGAAGAGLAVKATAATVLVAGTVGAGVALQEGGRDAGGRDGTVRAAMSAPGPATAADPSELTPVGAASSSGSGPDGGSNRGPSHNSGPGNGDEGERGDDRDGHSGSGGSDLDDPDDGRSRRSGPGREGGEEVDDDSDGRSGSDGASYPSGSSGPGSGLDLDDQVEDEDLDDGGSSSGSGGSGSSNSNSGSDDVDDFE